MGRHGRGRPRRVVRSALGSPRRRSPGTTRAARSRPRRP
jgi:hypothetical protein